MLSDNDRIKMRGQSCHLDKHPLETVEFSEVAFVFVVILERFSLGGYQILPLSDERVTTSWTRLQIQ